MPARARAALLEPEQRGDVVAVHVFADGKDLALAHIDAPGIAVVVVAAIQQLAGAAGLAHHRVATRYQPVDHVLGITRYEQAAHRPQEFIDDLVSRSMDAGTRHSLDHRLPGGIRMQRPADRLELAGIE